MSRHILCLDCYPTGFFQEAGGQQDARKKAKGHHKDSGHRRFQYQTVQPFDIEAGRDD